MTLSAHITTSTLAIPGMKKMSSAIHVIFVAVVALCYVKNSQSYTYEHAYCTDLKPQNILDINQIMGVWYAVEIIPHLETQAGTIVFDSCPVIHISEGNLDYYSSYQTPSYDYSQYQQPGYSQYNQLSGNSQYNQQSRYSQYNQQSGYSQYNQQQYPGYSQYPDTQSRYNSMRSTEDYPRPGDHGYVWDDTYGNFNNKEYRGLRLVWDESDANNKIEYNIRFNNTRRGFWVSSGPIGDSKTSHYSQFAGTIQVIKAVHDHLVLTICQRLPEAQLFTVILSREPLRLQRQVIHGIHQLLNKRDLTTEAIRKVCRNGTTNLNVSIWYIIAAIIISNLHYIKV